MLDSEDWESPGIVFRLCLPCW